MKQLGLTRIMRVLAHHPGVELRVNLKSTIQRCHLFEVAILWELTEETTYLPLACLQGGCARETVHSVCTVPLSSELGTQETVKAGF